MDRGKAKLIIVGYIPDTYDQDSRVYDSIGLARTIKCNGGGLI